MTTPKVDHGLDHADPDLAKAHPKVRERWPVLERRLQRDGFAMRVIEVYRPELRQRWLYGQSRTVGELALKGIPASFARPSLPRVTNAWSAATSAHGWTATIAGGIKIPNAAALDVDPVGQDGRPWSADDPWDAWLAQLARYGPEIGLVHFTSHGKITDRPHLQLVEWDDRDHLLNL